MNDINVTYKDTTKPNEVYYREKATSQLNMFSEFEYYFVYYFDFDFEENRFVYFHLI